MGRGDGHDTVMCARWGFGAPPPFLYSRIETLAWWADGARHALIQAFFHQVTLHALPQSTPRYAAGWGWPFGEQHQPTMITAMITILNFWTKVKVRGRARRIMELVSNAGYWYQIISLKQLNLFIAGTQLVECISQDTWMWRANSCLMAMCPPPLVGSFPQETNTAFLLCKEDSCSCVHWANRTSRRSLTLKAFSYERCRI